MPSGLVTSWESDGYAVIDTLCCMASRALGRAWVFGGVRGPGRIDCRRVILGIRSDAIHRDSLSRGAASARLVPSAMDFPHHPLGSRAGRNDCRRARNRTDGHSGDSNPPPRPFRLAPSGLQGSAGRSFGAGPPRDREARDPAAVPAGPGRRPSYSSGQGVRPGTL